MFLSQGSMASQQWDARAIDQDVQLHSTTSKLQQQAAHFQALSNLDLNSHFQRTSDNGIYPKNSTSRLAPADIHSERASTTSHALVLESTSTPSNEILSTAGPSAARRIDAIAKLKRAASQREMRGRGATDNSRVNTPTGDAVQSMGLTSEPPNSRLEESSAHPESLARGMAESPLLFLTRPGGPGDSKPVSPIPPMLTRLEQLRSDSRSPHSAGREGAATPPGEGSLLNRSRSQRGEARSPLPSLEQLRARILQERATAGLARSASTSAASAAARAYALEKLLGESPREGAVSPVSDTAEEQEKEQTSSSSTGGQFLTVTDARRTLLRRSRTIGHLSAAAEAQRKAAFVRELDEGVPDNVRSVKRSSRRFAKAPPGGRTSISSKASGLPAVVDQAEDQVRNQEDFASAPVTETDAINARLAGGGEVDLSRSQSQRQIARTELLRKLSSRGQRSPLPPAAIPAWTPVDASQSADLPKFVSESSRDTHGRPPALTVPVQAVHGLPHPLSPGLNLLTVPGANSSPRSPSSRASTAISSQNDDERNRASQMAILMGEEAFEYEKLLDMGYTSEDAYDRVARSRNGSYMDTSDNASQQLDHEYESAHDVTSFSSPPLRPVFTEWSSAAPALLPLASQSKEDDGRSKHTSLASIPLRLDARGEFSMGGSDDDQDDVELLQGSVKSPLYNRREGTWPESVTSAATSDFSSPKRSGSIKRDSSNSTSISKFRPNLSIAPTSSLGRIEDVLTPGSSHYSSDSPTKSGGHQHSGHQMAGHQQSALTSCALSDEPGVERAYTSTSDNAHFESIFDEYADERDVQVAANLGDFRRLDDTYGHSRMARDAVVQQSSAAQAIAAASDETRRGLCRTRTDDTISTQTSDTIGTIRHPSATKDLAISSRAAFNNNRPLPATPVSPLLPLTGVADTQDDRPNDDPLFLPKIAPSSSIPSETSHRGLHRKPSQLQAFSVPSIGKGVSSSVGENVAMATDDKEKNHGVRAPTFFTTLRRKASNAAARVNGSAHQSDSPPSSRKFGSLLKRRPSGTKRSLAHPRHETEPEVMHSHNTSQLSVNSSSTVKGVTSSTEVGAAAIKSPIYHASSQNVGPIASPGEGGGPLSSASLAPATTAALHRYSRILTSTKESTSFSTIPGLTRQHIENPPRKYLFSLPILQIVTSTTVKDRFVFVFSDLLVIAKPLTPSSAASTLAKSNASALPTLDWSFSVKQIVDISQMSLVTVSQDDRRQSVKSVPLMQKFIHDFSRHPEQAIDSIITQSNLPKTSSTIAQLLHQTPELDRQQLSDYLFNSDDPTRGEVTKSFIGLEKYAGVSIESALRSLLLEIRFPSSLQAFQALLLSFAAKWTSTNRGLIKDTFSEKLAVDLVFAIMTLNDALHSNSQATPSLFHKPMPQYSKEEFLHNFRRRDEAVVLSDRTLTRIYTSISQEAIKQALSSDEAGPRFTARIRSPGVPTKLIYGVFSQPIRVSIPTCDPDFTIRLYGKDLAFQPQVLSFDQHSTQEFRIMSKSLGVKNLVFIKAGRNARHYQTSFREENSLDFAVPRSINVAVERAFKQHCFTFSTYGSTGPGAGHGGGGGSSIHTGQQHTFSVEGDAQRDQCVDLLNERRKVEMEEGKHRSPMAQAVALHVLREALQDPEEPTPPPQRGASSAAGNDSSLPANTAQRKAQQGEGSATMMNRQESVSKHYYQSQGAPERELRSYEGEERRQVQEDRGMYNGTSSAPVIALKGEELILTVKQNSLLSIVVAHTQRNGKERMV
ncbi:hypothetical protein CBS101457_005179 [Exobasidium rhododendri]|nr:hypothetical protein CBS101457_005179 [Exobasidium rhododendri]